MQSYLQKQDPETQVDGTKQNDFPIFTIPRDASQVSRIGDL